MILYKGVKLKNIEGIALWPFVFVKSKYPSITTLNHEKIHLRQQVEMLILPFYIWYLVEWLMGCTKYRSSSKSYYNISFEREAYRNQSNLEYLKQRKPWSFLQYI